MVCSWEWQACTTRYNSRQSVVIWLSWCNGNIKVQSRKERRYRCTCCKRTFVGRKGTVLEGLKKPVDQVSLVIALLAYGCPIAAIVFAFGLDERTVKSWLRRAGGQCQRVHEHYVASQTLDLGQVQADEIRVKTQKGTLWMALALQVSTRLWLGVRSAHIGISV